MRALNFVVKKSKMELSFPECLFFENARENFKLNLVLVLVLKSKALFGLWYDRYWLAVQN